MKLWWIRRWQIIIKKHVMIRAFFIKSIYFYWTVFFSLKRILSSLFSQKLCTSCDHILTFHCYSICFWESMIIIYCFIDCSAIYLAISAASLAVTWPSWLKSIAVYASTVIFSLLIYASASVFAINAASLAESC